MSREFAFMIYEQPGPHTLESKLVSPKTAANRLGHTDTALMLKWYARPGDAEQRKAGDDSEKLYE